MILLLLLLYRPMEEKATSSTNQLEAYVDLSKPGWHKRKSISIHGLRDLNNIPCPSEIRPTVIDKIQLIESIGSSSVTELI